MFCQTMELLLRLLDQCFPKSGLQIIVGPRDFQVCSARKKHFSKFCILSQLSVKIVNFPIQMFNFMVREIIYRDFLVRQTFSKELWSASLKSLGNTVLDNRNKRTQNNEKIQKIMEESQYVGKNNILKIFKTSKTLGGTEGLLLIVTGS